MSRALFAYIPAVVWAATLLFVGAQSGLRPPDLYLSIPMQDKVFHFLAYSVLGGLAGWGRFKADRRPTRAWPVLFVVGLVGACDELHQRTVSGRSAELADWMADAMGAALAFALVSWLLHTRSAQRRA